MSESNRAKHCWAARRWTFMVGLAIAASWLLTPALARADLGTDLQLYSSMDHTTPYLPTAYWEDASDNDHFAVTNPAAYDGTGDLGGVNRGTAIDFTGGDLRMKVTDGLNADFDPGSNDYSVSLWYNEATTGSFAYLLAKGNTVSSSSSGFCLGIANGSPLIRMNDVNEYTTTKTSVNSNMGDISAAGWHHLVAVFDRSGTHSANGTVSLYVDNVLRNSTVLPSFPPYDVTNPNKEFVLGGQEASIGYNFDGYLDDVAVYRGVLSATDVTTLYSAPTLDAGTISSAGISPVTIHNFVANRNQEETFGTVADDFDGNDGVLMGDAAQVIDPTRGKVINLEPNASDYVDYGDILDPMSSSYTAAFWFKISDTGATQILAGKGMNYGSGDDGWSIGCGDHETLGDSIFVRANYGDDEHRIGLRKSLSEAAFDEWHHVAFVIDQENGVLKAYLDGEGSGLSGTDNDWITMYSGNAFTPGVEFDADSRGNQYDHLAVGLAKSTAVMDGQVDDFAVWTRALTDAEILELYGGKPPLPPIPGDTNNDRIVNETDAAVLAQHWGAYDENFTYEDGDFNGDYVVNVQDAAILAANWSDSNEAAGASAVPEPTTSALAILGVLMLVIRRRRAC